MFVLKYLMSVIIALKLDVMFYTAIMW